MHKRFPGWRHTKIAIIHGVTLAASCGISYWLITHILGPVSYTHLDVYKRQVNWVSQKWGPLQRHPGVA